jgi:hypothetical protein
MPQGAKRQHYVPRFYLEWFTTKETGSRTPTFWVYDKRGGEPRRQTPINTAVEASFYDLEHDGQAIPVEYMLAELESGAKPALERWGSGDFDRRDIPVLARFLAYMYSRVPSNIATVEESGTVLAREMLKASADDSDEEIAATIKDSGVEDVTVDQVREWYRNADTIVAKMDMPEGYWLAASLELAPVVEAALLRMNWSLCRGPADYGRYSVVYVRVDG